MCDASNLNFITHIRPVTGDLTSFIVLAVCTESLHGNVTAGPSPAWLADTMPAILIQRAASITVAQTWASLCGDRQSHHTLVRTCACSNVFETKSSMCVFLYLCGHIISVSCSVVIKTQHTWPQCVFDLWNTNGNPNRDTLRSSWMKVKV